MLSLPTECQMNLEFWPGDEGAPAEGRQSYTSVWQDAVTK